MGDNYPAKKTNTFQKDFLSAEEIMKSYLINF